MRDMSAWMGLFFFFSYVFGGDWFLDFFIRDAQFYTMYYFILPRAGSIHTEAVDRKSVV